MKRIFTILVMVFVHQLYAQLPVIPDHPRIYLEPVTKAGLMAKVSGLDPDWLDLKDEADDYATRQVLSWTPANVGVWDDNYIFYNYYGSSWDEATMTLGMAHQLTKGNNTGNYPTIYSNKLLQLADTIISGYNNYPPCSGCDNMFLGNSSYANRHVGIVIGIIYDWCYDELGTTRKNALLNLINDWYTYMRIQYNVYQSHYAATGNYYFGNVSCASFLGYATFGDSPYSQEMIDYARQRVLGAQSGSLPAAYASEHWLKQSYTGGIPTGASESWLGNPSYTGAPHKDGLHVQGWSYGAGTTERLIDYCFMVKTATGENIADSLRYYFNKTSQAFVHALTPNRFQVDHANDWGSFIGSLLGYSLPLRLSAVSAGTSQGPYDQYLYNTWVQPTNLTNSWNEGYATLSWEKLLYKNSSLPSSPFNYDPYYPQPSTHIFTSVPIDNGLPKFYMRTDWSSSAVWATINLSNAVYDDHDHNNAGHFTIIRGDSHDGDDQLLIAANEIGDLGFGTNGIEGGTCYHGTSSLSNTLYFNDYGDYSDPTEILAVGGQDSWGYEEPTHMEQNDTFSYFRADLTSAYFANGQIPDTVNRTLKYFRRSFLYLRNADLFVTYDDILAKNSTNILGQYEKHLRWHFLEDPVISGNNITAVMDNSKLYVHTVIPAVVNITKVNESNNPDNIFGPGADYAFNTYSWRAEVRVPSNPLQQDILTVMQPGSSSAVEMITTAFSTDQNNMQGSLIKAYGRDNVVLFNKNHDKYLTPVTLASYPYTWTANNWHTLCGMVPNGIYQVDYDQVTINVSLSPTGNVTASPSGVLSFYASSPIGIPVITENDHLDIYPNPSSGNMTVSWNFPTSTVSNIVITNALGEMVQYIQPESTKNLVYVSMENSGVYFISLYEGSRHLATKKMIITR